MSEHEIGLLYIIESVSGGQSMTAEAAERAVVTVNEYGKVVVLYVVGELCLGNIRGVEQILDDQVANQPDVVALDCKKLEFIDSSAIGTLVKFHNLSMHRGIRLILVELNPSIIRLLETAKLDRIFSLMTRDEFKLKCLDGSEFQMTLGAQYS
jgi:anti-sigma B factor antagonist